MTPYQSVSVLAFLFALSGLWLLCVGWRNYRLDAFRQELFAVREELFDFAAAGNIPFDDPAYWRLRLLINSVIRFGHRLNLSGAALPALMMPNDQESDGAHAMWVNAARKSRADVQPELFRFHDRVFNAVVRQLFLVSPLTVPLFFAWFVLPAFRAHVKATIAKVEDEAALEDELTMAAKAAA